MKRCPQCKQAYTDETLSFCLDDGAWLVDELSDTEAGTVILPESAFRNKRLKDEQNANGRFNLSHYCIISKLGASGMDGA